MGTTIQPDLTGFTQAPRTRTLSKSDFKLARTCTAKLYFRENGYPDNRESNDYLAMLAEGGYMVEALAKARYPDGIQLEYGRDVAAHCARTLEALRADSVTLFEATLLVGRKQARVDILQKKGNVVRLLEVKAKSFEGTEHLARIAAGKPGVFRSKQKPYGVLANWEEKLEDVTYQSLLLRQLLSPTIQIVPYLVLVDKDKTAELDNIPGLFEIVRRQASDGTSRLHTARYIGTAEQLAKCELLTEVNVSEEVAMLSPDVETASAMFEALLDQPLATYSASIERDSKCAQCEFRTSTDERSGFADCWGELSKPSPHMLELFSIGKAKAPDGDPLVRWMYDRKEASLLEIPLDGLVSKNDNRGGIAARQRRQIEQTQLGQIYIGPELRAKVEALRGPLHFIDFETSRLALPYHRGMQPYGLVAFQWSAHTAEVLGGPIVHREWLNTVDLWPNQSFAESLRDAIGDDGPVLTWSRHEPTTLRQIVEDSIKFGRHTPDLAEWIRRVTEERIVDLHQWACRDYYHPGMRGRTSIKVVLDALWRTDATMRQQFEQWTGRSADASADPYLALPPVEINGSLLDVHEGTGAMRAYQEMMHGADKHDPVIRDKWSQLLRQYCALDTLSMVLILEHWRRQVGLA